MTHMRGAIVRKFGGSDCIEIVCDLVPPVLWAANQILVNVLAAGVNPVDTYIRSGQYAKLPQLPYTPGRDGAGVVEEVGTQVTHLKRGDRVWFADTLTGTAADRSLVHHAFKLPEEVSFFQGACIGIPYLTAYRALFLLGKAKKGDVILVHGASGGVGLAACQLASWRGVNVVGTAGTAEGMALASKNGCIQVFNHRDVGYAEEMKKRFKGFDVILEMAAHKNLDTDLGLLAHGGRVAVIGSRGEVTVNPRLLMTSESSIFGVGLAHTTAEEYHTMGTAITDFLSCGKYLPVVHKEYELEQLGQAHQDIIESQGARGNLVVYNKYMCDEYNVPLPK